MAIPGEVTNVADWAFDYCPNLAGVYFCGNVPGFGSDAFGSDAITTAYYRPGTTGWGPTFAGLPTALWNPLAQTGNGNFGLQNNQFGFDITGTTNIPVVVEASTHLSGGAWIPLQSVSLTNGSFHFSDPQWTNFPNRFYRISSP